MMIGSVWVNVCAQCVSPFLIWIPTNQINTYFGQFNENSITQLDSKMWSKQKSLTCYRKGWNNKRTEHRSVSVSETHSRCLRSPAIESYTIEKCSSPDFIKQVSINQFWSIICYLRILWLIASMCFNGRQSVHLHLVPEEEWVTELDDQERIKLVFKVAIRSMLWHPHTQGERVWGEGREGISFFISGK